MKPLIGVTVTMEADELYYRASRANIRAIEMAGGIPVMLGYYFAEPTIDQMVEKLDGLYLTGGYDIDPTMFGEEPHPDLGTIIPSRDPFEMAIITRMLAENKPVLAVCRGMQILNIAMGGDMYQDIYAQIDRQLLQHSQNAPVGHGSHFVDVAADSMLWRLTGEQKLKVNSHHHQAVRNVKSPLKTCGTASDFVIEAIESTTHRFVLGLQWHPESMFAEGDDTSQAIYEAFIKACLN